MTWWADVSTEPERPTVRPAAGCLVCGRLEKQKAVPLVVLPNGRKARVCAECFDDQFRLPEAVRRSERCD